MAPNIWGKKHRGGAIQVGTQVSLASQGPGCFRLWREAPIPSGLSEWAPGLIPGTQTPPEECYISFLGLGTTEV